MIKESRSSQIRQIASAFPLEGKAADLTRLAEACLPVLSEIAPGGSACGEGAGDWLLHAFRALQARFFPENFSLDQTGAQEEAMDFLLAVIEAVLERERQEVPFDPMRDFDLMHEEEAHACSILPEYRAFARAFSEGHVYAFMRLSRVCTPYDTLGHVAGVHHIAMTMARQLLGTEVRVDPGLMSAAAMTHDMGKFGCRPSEGRRVPYLHYYYTYLFCRRFSLDTIGQAAANHSVWDLELDNLSVENLLLIYADFRVKSVYDKDHKEHVRFWTLKDSYQVILDKLDNVDEKKRRRYARVYERLRDFEDYMVSLGCSTEPGGRRGEAEKRQEPAFMSPDQVVRTFKHMAVGSNLGVMYNAGHEDRFVRLLDRIRSEKDWRHVRACLTVIGDYCAYLSQDHKDRILDFLRIMMGHRDGDIRRQAAAIAGRVLAGYEISFTKEIPEGYRPPAIGRDLAEAAAPFFRGLTDPEPGTAEEDRRHIGYAMKSVLRTLLETLPEEKRRVILDIYTDLCREPGDEVRTFILLDGACQVDYAMCGPAQARVLGDLAARALEKAGRETGVAALVFVHRWMRQGWRHERNLSDLLHASMPDLPGNPYCVRFLTARIHEFYGIPSVRGIYVYDAASLYLEDQRQNVPWIYKYVNLEILRRRQAENTDTNQLYLYASHLLNLLQFSGQIVNRLVAGRNLVEIMPSLEKSQRREIVLELLRALEIGEYAVSKYIPAFLGRICAGLSHEERESLTDSLEALTGSVNPRTVIVTMETVSAALAGLSLDGPKERQEADRLEGLLFRGLAHYEEEVSLETFYCLSRDLFGDSERDFRTRCVLFSDLARKVLTMVRPEGEGLYTYYRASGLGRLYRFLADAATEGLTVLTEEKRPAAFFPGTFDPFSLGHRAIVQEAVSMGYQVYLALDEFSWSKNTQPYEVRRKILAMSAADLKHVCLFPAGIPVNIASPRDLSLLRSLLGKDTAILAGEDVVAGASAYRAAPSENSIHTFPHILFARGGEEREPGAGPGPEEVISAPIRRTRLPAFYETVSSTRIRERVSDSMDISGLVDPMVQNYIFRGGFYTREPLYRKTARILPLSGGLLEERAPEALRDLTDKILPGETPESLEGWQIYVLRNAEAGGEPCAAVLWREVPAGDYLAECGSVRLAQEIRERVSGRVLVIRRLEGLHTDEDDMRLTVLNELMEYCQEQAYTYALWLRPGAMRDQILLHGFRALEEGSEVYVTDLRRPLVLFYDTHASFKEPFAGMPSVRQAIRRCHLRLLEAMTHLWPGSFVLCFESEILGYKMVRLITEENAVPDRPLVPRKLGDKMCVPFGRMLRGLLVPNTVTKTLHTEKKFNPELTDKTVCPFPGYASLEDQIRTIRSFERPVLLADDLYHEGRRINRILPILRREGIRLDRLITGVISGRGMDLARDLGVPVRAACRVPNLRTCLTESDLYPLVGGVSVETDRAPEGNLLPSVNDILPYRVPEGLDRAPLPALLSLSGVCLDNALDLWQVLEEAYASVYRRQLTLERIGEVLVQPRIPEGALMGPAALEETPSALLAGEKRKLVRLRGLTGPAERSSHASFD